MSLRVPAGATVAIVGENGAGKTTLAKLLCRMRAARGCGLYAPSTRGLVKTDAR